MQNAYKSLIQRILPPLVRDLFVIAPPVLVTTIASLSVAAETLTLIHKKISDPRSSRPPLYPLRLPAAGSFRKLEKAVAVFVTLKSTVSSFNSFILGTLKPAGQMSLTPPSFQAATLSPPRLSIPPFAQSRGVEPLLINDKFIGCWSSDRTCPCFCCV